MTRSIDASVLIAGGGPVGLTLAMDLASRGIDVIVVETRHAGEPPNVKCNQVSARSMEVFRRLGLAGKIRDTGLPPEFRIDVSCCVSATGKELSRIKLPSRAGRVRGEKGDDGWWPTAEWPHRINQLFLEPLLFEHAAAQPRIRILNRTEFQEFTPGRATASPPSPRPRQRRAHHHHLPLSRRLRRRPLVGAPRHRRGACRHSGGAARAVHLFPRAEADEHAARRAVLDVSRVQSAPLRHHDVDRRQGALADPQFPLQRRAGLRFRRSRLVDPQHPRRRAGFRIRDHLQGGLDRPPAGRRPLPERPRVHRRRRRASVDSARRLRHERRHRRCGGSGVDACRRAAGLGGAGTARRLSGGAPADHRSGVALRLQHVEVRSRSSAARFPPTSSATTTSARRRARRSARRLTTFTCSSSAAAG